VDLVPTLRATVSALADQELAGLNVVCELHPLPAVRCHVGAITKVLVGLLGNAAQAIAARQRDRPGPGTVQVRASVEGQMAVLTVRDDGTGIPDQVRAHLFEPFFTTRDVGQGSGQTLAVARSIVERHHGTIGVETEVGAGTTFTVRLPLADPAPASDADLWG
jgi:signal transduction histidine kinase